MEEKNEKVTMGYVEACNFIKQYMKSEKKSQVQVAKELDVSPSRLSGFLSGTYAAPHTVISAVEELAAISEQKKAAPKEPEYAETTVNRMVTNAIRYAHLQGKLSVAYGDAGIGKTMAFRNYLEKNAMAVGITISPVYSSVAGVLEKLSEQMGVHERVARKQTAEIINRLRGSGKVLVVDEAQHLTPRALDHLRCIADESGVGLCFIGNEEVYSKLKGGGDEKFAQLFSRLGMKPHVLVSDITREDVRAVFGKYVTEENALELLFRICRTAYGMRGAVNVSVNTINAFQEITSQGLTRMMREMDIVERGR